VLLRPARLVPPGSPKRKLRAERTATGMRIGNGARSRGVPERLKGSRRTRETCASVEGDAYAPAMLTRAIGAAARRGCAQRGRRGAMGETEGPFTETCRNPLIVTP